MSEALCELGVLGLTTTGQSLAAHHASNLIRVCVCDDDVSFIPQVINEYKTQTEAGEDNDTASNERASRCMLPSSNLEELVARLAQPRKIIIFGTYNDDVKLSEYWTKLSSLVEKGDMILRWGKEDEGHDKNITFYNNSIVGNLSKMYAKSKGIHLLEMVKLQCDRSVVFQGDGYDNAFMVGGATEAYKQLEPFISPLATIGCVGSDPGSVHYAQMIQRTIENGIMQAYAEGTDVLRMAAGYENQDIGRAFNKWQEGGSKASSYLSKISSKIFYKRDAMTKKGHVLDYILDSVELNTVDNWVTLEATRLGVPAPSVNAALETRFLSAMKDERVEASSILKVLDVADTPSVLKGQVDEDLQSALYCACMCIIAECFAVFQAASEVESWDVNFKECIRLWNLPGSILESTLLSNITSALTNNVNQEMKSLLTVPDVASELKDLHISWRRIVTLSFASAIPCPTLSLSLTHYDSLRSRKLPIGLIHAQRDYFDASGYSRVGIDGHFTTNWITEHTQQIKRRESAAQSKKKRKKTES